MKGPVAGPPLADQVAQALLERGVIRADQLPEAGEVISSVLDGRAGHAAVAAPSSAVPADRGRPRLAEIGGYAGAALVVAAAFLFLMQTWATLSPAGRSLILAGIALVLLAGAGAIGFLAGAWRDLRAGRAETRRRLVATLGAAGAGASGFAVGTWLAELQGQGQYDNTPVNGALAVALALLVIGYVLSPSLLTHLAMGIVTPILTLNMTDDFVEGRVASAWVGAISLMGVGLLWLVLTERGVFREQTAGRFVGAALAVFGSQLLLELEHGWPGYTLTFVLAAALFALYWWRTDWPYLAVAVVGLTVAVTEGVTDWTEGSLGAGGGVLAAGMTLLAASGAAFVMRSRREREAPLSRASDVTD